MINSISKLFLLQGKGGLFLDQNYNQIRLIFKVFGYYTSSQYM